MTYETSGDTYKITGDTFETTEVTLSAKTWDTNADWENGKILDTPFSYSQMHAHDSRLRLGRFTDMESGSLSTEYDSTTGDISKVSISSNVAYEDTYSWKFEEQDTSNGYEAQSFNDDSAAVTNNLDEILVMRSYVYADLSGTETHNVGLNAGKMTWTDGSSNLTGEQNIVISNSGSDDNPEIKVRRAEVGFGLEYNWNRATVNNWSKNKWWLIVAVVDMADEEIRINFIDPSTNTVRDSVTLAMTTTDTTLNGWDSNGPISGNYAGMGGGQTGKLYADNHVANYIQISETTNNWEYETQTKTFSSPNKPDLQNLVYDLDGLSASSLVQLKITGSPSGGTSESHTIPLDGSKTSYSINWSNSHTDFNVTVIFEIDESDLKKYPTVDQVELL